MQASSMALVLRCKAAQPGNTAVLLPVSTATVSAHSCWQRSEQDRHVLVDAAAGTAMAQPLLSCASQTPAGPSSKRSAQRGLAARPAQPLQQAAGQRPAPGMPAERCHSLHACVQRMCVAYLQDRCCCATALRCLCACSRPSNNLETKADPANSQHVCCTLLLLQPRQAGSGEASEPQHHSCA
jgi:hypothetical protein